MARITTKQLEQFKKLFLAEFGVSLNDNDALGQATMLLELVSRVRKPIEMHNV